MRSGFMSCLLLLLGSTVASAQPAPAAANPAPTPPASKPDEAAENASSQILTPTVRPIAPEPGPETAPSPVMGAASAPLFDYWAGGSGGPDRFWISAAYVHGWLKPTTQGTPLFTTGPGSAPVLGVLGQPGTSTLFSADDVRYNNLNGARGEVGFWMDDQQHVSLSVGALYLLQPTNTVFTAASDAAGSPVLARPVFNAVLGAEQSYLVAEPGVVAGNASIDARSELYGAEINAGYHNTLADGVRATALFGYRGMRFADGLTIQDQFMPLTNGVLTYEGGAVSPPSMLAERATFQTSNAFNGLQFGGQFRWQRQWLFVDTYGKLALGFTDERVKINGATALITPGAATRVVPGEVLTALTNIGQQRRQTFGAIPELGVNIGVDVLSCLRLKVGYSFLAWSSVARAADQIDRVVNPGRVPTDPAFGTVAGPARPTLNLVDHLLWVQMVNVGVELHY